VAYLPRADGVTFRCEACATELHDLRSVFLARRPGAGWRIECAQHDDAERQVNGGTLFGGGLHALEVYAELSEDQGFDPVELFEVFLRLRQQTDKIEEVAAEQPGRAAKG
jgi:hypothetical protein